MERFDAAAAELYRAMRKISAPRVGQWTIPAIVGALIFAAGAVAGNSLWNHKTAMTWQHRAVLDTLEQDIAHRRGVPIYDVRLELGRALELPEGADLTDGYFESAVDHLAKEIPRRPG